VATKTSPARRPAPRKRAARKRVPKKPVRTPTRQILSPWARDAVGIGLVVFALLSVLSVWFDAAGPAGHSISWLLHGTFGVAAVAFPVFGVYWGVLLLRDTAPDDRVRMFIGFGVAGLGLLGLLSLFRGNPSPLGGYADHVVRSGKHLATTE
jgi:DNA segregation ATPase FtsK/SpoIIIE, S-DNA-T family